MPAYFESGLFVREPAWHGLGTVLETPPESFEEARKIAGLDWDPEVVPAAYQKGKHYVQMPGWKAVIKPAHGDEPAKPLNLVHDTYGLITISEMEEIYQAIFGEPHMTIEAMGSLKDDKMVWFLARLDEPVQVTGDPSPAYPYGCVKNAFDSSAPCSVSETTIRVVCWNTWNASDAESRRTGREFIFRHSKNWRAKVEEAKAVVSGMRANTQRWLEEMNELTGHPITEKHVTLFLKHFIPDPPETVISDRVAANIAEARGAVRGALESASCEGIRDNAYGLVQAAGEYLDHLRKYRDGNTYLGRTLLRPEPLRAKAISIVRDVLEEVG